MLTFAAIRDFPSQEHNKWEAHLNSMPVRIHRILATMRTRWVRVDSRGVHDELQPGSCNILIGPLRSYCCVLAHNVIASSTQISSHHIAWLCRLNTFRQCEQACRLTGLVTTEKKSKQPNFYEFQSFSKRKKARTQTATTNHFRHLAIHHTLSPPL
jgi:hypothetical protein